MRCSKRQYYKNGLIAIVIVGVLISISTLILNNYFINWDFLKQISIYNLIVIFTLIVLYFILVLIKFKGLKRYINHEKLINNVEINLIAIGAYEKKENINYFILPKIKVKDNTINIYLKNLKIRSIIEKYLDSFSTALPERYIVEDYYITQNNSMLIIEYEDIQNYKHETYTLEEYRNKVKSFDLLEMYFDKKHVVNMNDYPHFLISGTTGSGKSYFVNELVAQAIIKGWEVVVLDLKRSYGLFQKHIDYVYEIDDILGKLVEIESEMNLRMQELQPELDKNPRALAIDIGFKPKLVVLEEYISLQSAFDKKKKEELERVVKNIGVLARQSNIHLMVVLQSAGTENIQATTRSNLTKVLLGNAQSNILNATFGNGVDIPNVNGRLSKGEGLIQLERITILRVPSITDIESFN